MGTTRPEPTEELTIAQRFAQLVQINATRALSSDESDEYAALSKLIPMDDWYRIFWSAIDEVLEEISDAEQHKQAFQRSWCAYREHRDD